MNDYLEPVVATIVGDISDLLVKIGEAQGAMAEFAAAAPELGQLQAMPSGFSEEAAAAEMTAAVQAAQQQADAVAPDLEAALSQSTAAAFGAAGQEAGQEFTRVFEQELGEIRYVDLPVGGADTSMDERWASFAAGANQARDAQSGLTQETAQANLWLRELGTQLEAVKSAMGESEAAAQSVGASFGSAAARIRDFGGSAIDLPMQLGLTELLAMGAATGVLALSSAVVGVGLVLADFGGEAKGDLQQVESAFRGTAAQAAQAFEPALESITQTMVGAARALEPDIAEIFHNLSGPAQAFFQGLASSAEQGMNALVPALAQMDPLIATITSDLGPLFEGVAGFVQEMASAFEGNGGTQALAAFAAATEQLLPVLGQLVGTLGEGLIQEATLLEPVIRAIADAFNALGPTGDMLIVDLLAIGRTISGITGPINAMVGSFETLGKVVEFGHEMLSGLGSLLGLTDTAANAASMAQLGMQAALDQEAMAAAEAAAASGELGAALETEGMAAEGAAAENEAAAAAMEAAGVAAEGAGAALLGFSAAGGAAALAIVGIGTALFELGTHWQAVSGFFEQGADDAYTWGSDIGQGIARGIEDAWNFIVKPIEDSINGIKNMFTSGFGILSPSTVMREYGQYIGQGLGLGVLDSLPGVQGQIGTFTAGTLGVFTGGASFGGGVGGGFGGGVTTAAPSASGATTVNLTVNLSVTQPLASPQEIADAVIPALQDANLLNGITMAAHSGLKGGPGR